MREEKKTAVLPIGGTAEFKMPGRLSGFDCDDLAAFIIPARRAGGVSAKRAATLAAFGECVGVPTVGGLAGAQAHL